MTQSHCCISAERVSIESENLISPLQINDIFGDKSQLGKCISNNFFEIYNIHGLIQLIGYIKYKHRYLGPIFFRGQTKLHDGSIKPLLFRGIKSLNKAKKREIDLSEYIKLFSERKAFIKNTQKISYEPLLQHYGIKTGWIDIVDNIWSALWFSSHQAYTCGKFNEYIRYEKSNEQYSFIIIMFFGKRKSPISNAEKMRIEKLCDIKQGDNINLCGYFETNSYKIIDLRYMSHSLYRRPHAQHALLAKRKAIEKCEHIDYKDAVVAIAKIKTKYVLNWLGVSALNEVQFMFPSPSYDYGYQFFLEKAPQKSDILGSINIY